MTKRGRRYRGIREKTPSGVLGLREAIEFLKANPGAKFDETMELGIRLGAEMKKSEQSLRGVVALPHGTGKKVRVVVFASGSAADAARAEGADHVGFEDLVEKVKGGWSDFDIAIATPDAMKEVRKLGRVLGPRGLMPNAKSGTVTDDTAGVVRQSKAGRVEFRMDKHGNINVAFGKRSFDTDKLVENADAVLAGLKAEMPASIRGEFIKKCTVTTTMGVGLQVNAGT